MAKRPKVIQFISQNPGKTGVTKIMNDIAKILKIPALCLKKTVFAPRFKELKAIGRSGIMRVTVDVK